MRQQSFAELVHDDRSIDRLDDAMDDAEERIARLRTIHADLDEECRTVLDRFYCERMGPRLHRHVNGGGGGDMDVRTWVVRTGTLLAVSTGLVQGAVPLRTGWNSGAAAYWGMAGVLFPHILAPR